MNGEAVLEDLQLQLIPLDKFIGLFAASLGEPKFYRGIDDRGFRFDAPDVRHFCLLKAVRVISALNASIELARGGYLQEINVLMRTVAEFSTHIDFVLGSKESEEQRSTVDKYIQDFFADSQRDREAEIKRAQVPQGLVHASIGRTLDKIAEDYGDSPARVPAAKLYSNTYRVYSNYVHGKYPEVMDLYGGTPGRFHLRGMSGTPKDDEILAIIQSFLTTGSNALLAIVQGLNLYALVDADPVLEKWYRQIFEQTEGNQ